LAARAPIRRFGVPGVIAAAMAWRYSQPASFMVGHAMAIDCHLLAG
jgi:NAD(P)-dependent dehydrogenase (short-subunit alcohol dehydrogenase family)